MAANSPHTGLYLDENVKMITGLPNALIRLCASYQDLNKKFEDNLKESDDSFRCFESQSSAIKNASTAWRQSEDGVCSKTLREMRQHEDEMMMFQDEKIALLEENLLSLESYLSKMSTDLRAFQKVLQPNMIKLPTPHQEK